MIVKIISLIAGSVFFYGAFLTGKGYDSTLIKISAISFIVICLILGVIDGFIYVHEFDAHTAYHLSRIVIFGFLYTFLGAGFFLKRTELGNIGKWTGLAGLLGGICLVTIVLVIPGVIFYAVFEVLLIVFFYSQWSAINKKSLND